MEKADVIVIDDEIFMIVTATFYPQEDSDMHIACLFLYHSKDHNSFMLLEQFQLSDYKYLGSKYYN